MRVKQTIKKLLIGALFLSFTGCSNNSQKNVKDGTYTGKAKGYGGDIIVDVTFSSGTISAIDVKSSSETKTWGDSALNTIPKYIMNAQSIQTDVVTGATVTSQAVQNAVKDAIQEAHGDVHEWNQDASGQHKVKEVEKEADVVIVGGGISGMTAALRLQQLGMDCILVEKSETLGGIMQYGGRYSQVYADDENTSAFDELPSNLSAVLKDTVAWQKSDLGIVFDKENVESEVWKYYSSQNDNIGELLAREVEVSGAQLLLQTCMTGFEKENDQITGISAIDADGTNYHISAQNIILATGSGTSDTSSINYAYNENDMQKLMEDIDGQADKYESSLVKDCVEIEENHIVDGYYALQKSLKYPSILVDADGNRFVNEETSRFELNQAICNAGYLVMDGSAYKKWKEALLESSAFLQEEEKNISSDELVNVFHQETLKETCADAGVDYNGLVSELENYNTCNESGEEDQFGRSVNGSFDEEKDIYIVKLIEGTYINCGGIEIDSDLRVLNRDGNAIENVYAIGSCANRIQENSEGLENAWAFVSGKMVADALCEE